MMRRSGRWMVAVGCLVMATVVMAEGTWGARVAEAGEGQEAVAPDSQEFSRIKNLAGRWEGTTAHMEAPAEPAVVEYKVTSGGSAVVETLFPGTPHEMVSVYHDVNGKLAMTHYCMLHNQPQLALTRADSQHLELSLADSPGIDPARDRHMHSLSITWQDPNRLTQVWTSYEGGKPNGSTTITLSRAR